MNPAHRPGSFGSATVEFVLAIPVLAVMLWFLVYVERMTDSRLSVEDVAHQAARAASQQRSTSAAAAQARDTAAAALVDAGITCQSLDVDTSGSLRPGGTVSVAVSCTVDLRDLALLGLPGSKVIAADFASPVDVHRGPATTAAARGGAAP